MKSFFKLLVLLIISFSLLGLSLSCKKTTPSETPSPSASESQSEKPPADNLNNLDPSSVSPQITADYETAKQKALAWKADATLYSASAKINSSLNFEDVVEVFTFGSPTDLSNWWTISISVRSRNYVRALIPKEDYLGANLTAVRTQYWKINYIEAFQIAEKNGGEEWREKQDKDYQITATLSHGEPKGYLYWIIDYQTSDGSDKNSVKIDANSGEVINV